MEVPLAKDAVVSEREELEVRLGREEELMVGLAKAMDLVVGSAITDGSGKEEELVAVWEDGSGREE